MGAERCACPSCTATDADGGGEQIEGQWYCADCAGYSVDDDGTVYCATHDVPGDIAWGRIEVPPAGTGAPSRVYGRSRDGRRWISELRGEWTVPRPVDDGER